jgi:hypothetical protein
VIKGRDFHEVRPRSGYQMNRFHIGCFHFNHSGDKGYVVDLLRFLPGASLFLQTLF